MIALLTALLLAFASHVNAAPPDGYKPVRNWDFGTNIRTEAEMRSSFLTRYIHSNGTLDHINDEWERYRDNNNHVFYGGGLSLVARVVGGLYNGGIQSGMLRSRWSGKYGYFEARIRVPAGRGMWPAFWLLPQDGKWPPEIDIMEIANNGVDTTRHSFHFVHGPPEFIAFSRLNSRQAYVPGQDYAAGFHTFAVLWTPTSVKHYVDDVLVVDRRWLWLHNNGTSGGPAHVLINLAVGGGWPGAPQKLTDFPAKMGIDWVRVWQ